MLISYTDRVLPLTRDGTAICNVYWCISVMTLSSCTGCLSQLQTPTPTYLFILSTTRVPETIARRIVASTMSCYTGLPNRKHTDRPLTAYERRKCCLRPFQKYSVVSIKCAINPREIHCNLDLLQLLLNASISIVTCFNRFIIVYRCED